MHCCPRARVARRVPLSLALGHLGEDNGLDLEAEVVFVLGADDLDEQALLDRGAARVRVLEDPVDGVEGARAERGAELRSLGGAFRRLAYLRTSHGRPRRERWRRSVGVLVLLVLMLVRLRVVLVVAVRATPRRRRTAGRRRVGRRRWPASITCFLSRSSKRPAFESARVPGNLIHSGACGKVSCF